MEGLVSEVIVVLAVLAVAALWSGAATLWLDRIDRRRAMRHFAKQGLREDTAPDGLVSSPVAVRFNYAQSEVESFGALLTDIGQFLTALERAFDQQSRPFKGPVPRDRPRLVVTGIRDGSIVVTIAGGIGALVGVMAAVVSVVEFFKLLAKAIAWLQSQTGRSPGRLDDMPGEVSPARMREILRAARGLFRRGVVEIDIRIREDKGEHRFVLSRQGVEEALHALEED